VLGEVVGVHISKCLLNDGVFDTFGTGIILLAGGPSAYAEVTPQSRRSSHGIIHPLRRAWLDVEIIERRSGI
jgi:hypothetical protein